MANNNDVVFVDLDKKRELRFGHKAMKRMLSLSGKSVEELEGESGLDLDELEQIYFYGLQKDAKENGETLTLDMMEDILDCAPSYDYLFDKMQQAFAKAMGKFSGNGQTAAKAAPTRRR